MDRKIIIEKNALTVRMAMLKDNEFIYFYISELFEPEIQNKVVIGQVMQVVKNLNAIFVDYGNEKNGMLHFKQIPEMLQDKIQPGSRLPVQIIKQNVGEKGHKLTAKLNIAGQYLVCLPFEPGINISKKITDVKYRKILKETLQALENPFKYGFIVRTHAEKATLQQIIKDAKSLIDRTHDLMAHKDYLSKGTVLYEEMPMIKQRVIEALSNELAYEVICNDEEYLCTLKQLSKEYPCHQDTVFTYYKESFSIWSTFSLNKKIEELLRRKVWLRNGGNLIIDYTEAMTIIDVNSAKAVLTKSPEKAVLQLNKEAIREGILQMLRRNLSGMIIMDLVEMKNDKYKEEVYEYAKMLLSQYEDRQTKVYPLTELGLMQFSRTKKYQCLPHQLLSECEQCKLPYGEESFLQEMIKLEEKIRQLEENVHRQDVYLTVCGSYYDKMQTYSILKLLEEAYTIKLHVEKAIPNKNKNILCQFYN